MQDIFVNIKLVQKSANPHTKLAVKGVRFQVEATVPVCEFVPPGYLVGEFWMPTKFLDRFIGQMF